MKPQYVRPAIAGKPLIKLVGKGSWAVWGYHRWLPGARSGPRHSKPVILSKSIRQIADTVLHHPQLR